MKKKIATLVLLLVLLLSGITTSRAQTTLSAGDIAFIGVYTDGSGGVNDSFTFITLKNISAGTVIYFTDNGWDGTTPWVASTSEVHWAWTAPAGGAPIGTIVNVIWSSGTTPTVSSGTASSFLYGITWHYATAGDNLMAYQISGSWSGRPSSPTFIAALDFDRTITFDNSDGWSTGTAPSGYEEVFCALPNGLTNGTNCVALFNSTQTYEYDNCRYNGTLTGSASVIRKAINNYSNWTGSDATPFDITSNAFQARNITPDVPAITSISPTNGSSLGGTSVTITGTNLTGATAVKFGTTNATSYIVNSVTQITATSPAGSVGTVNITVITADGTSATSSSDQFTYFSSPTLTTNEATSIAITSATLGGDVSADGGASITERGVVYSSTDATPTIGESSVIKDENGTGTGTFSKSITGLSSNTTYYVCAYATNAAGTNYGNVVNFKTNIGTNIDYLKTNSLSIYPNPATDGFTIDVGKRVTTVSIYNLDGKLILSQRAKDKTNINISSLQQGTYIVKVNEAITKLVKE